MTTARTTGAAFEWPDDAVAVLKRLWANGASASEIAAHIGQGVSRNAVIGKVTRLKLPKRGGTGHISEAQRSEARQRRVHGNKSQPKVNAIVSRASAARSLPPGPIHLDDETDVGVDVSKRVGLIDLTNHTCRWPVGLETGSKQLFCGCYAMVEAGPYCALHSTRAGIGYGRGPRP